MTQVLTPPAPQPVTDNAGSLTVDAPVGTPVRVDPTGTTTQPVSLAAVPTVTEKQDQPANSTATWTSATTVNTALTVATTGYGTANISIQTPSTATAGVLSIEVSDDNTVWYPAGAVRVDNALAENVVQVAGPGIVQSRMYAVSVDAMTQVRVRLSTVIAGTGNTIVRIGTVAGGIEPLVATLPTRTICAFIAQNTVPVAAEALMSLTPTRALVAGAGATSQTVTAGKVLRLTGISVSMMTTGAAVLQGYFVLRAVPSSGTLAVTSPVLWVTRVSTNAAVASTIGRADATFGDGIELPSGAKFGISHVASATGGTIELALNGYEF